MNKLYIGIDPDIDKSGVAIWSKKDKSLELKNLSFFELLDFLKEKNLDECHLVIEGGWLNKSNWHTSKFGSDKINAVIGNRTGANHQVGKLIVEMCVYLGLNHQVVKPKSKKLDAKNFRSITGFLGKTNQEQRDAAMLVFGI